MRALWLPVLAGWSLAATILDPKDCNEFPCLIFDDDFDFLDHNVWEHEITMSGGGNWEFQAYVNNRSISYTRDSTLFIKPELVSNWEGEGFLFSGELSLWGMNGRNDVCTSNSYSGCSRIGSANNLVNPVLSARLRTLSDFAFRYGRVEVRAKMPRGDWLWPAVWMLPRNWPYGRWPASGEIDIVEARGNENYGNLGNQYGGTTLHWGPYFHENKYDLTHKIYAACDGSFADSFHIWRVDWTKDSMKFYVDDTLELEVDPGTNFWDFGSFGDQIDNPWSTGSKMAPFDQEFYFIVNLAVGGVNGFFPDDVTIHPPKPWKNWSGTAFLDFWKERESWLPTWRAGEKRISERAALQLDYIRVWKMESVEQ
ncbi:beta-1,3-glucan-binding protein-like [Penaeus chinensis]|uniref:beta-1,3-glucan-binding protein-like n=1 Tax=Penaeus chinensis TaxID=139456 RepID=UPI001FB795B3|nr:beta-1,3-glucan-binding protein-like [Penaeus chinensis]